MAKGGFHPPLAPGDAPELRVQLDHGDDPQLIVDVAKQHIAALANPDPALSQVEPSAVTPDAGPPVPAPIATGEGVGVPAAPDLVITLIPPKDD